MSYALTSGQVAKDLATTGVTLSAATIQRYARIGRIPSRKSPGGRYRYDLAEVRAALSTRSADETLIGSPLTGGPGSGELPVDSESERLRRAARGHVSTAAGEPAPAGTAPAAVHDLLTHAAHRVLAFV